MSNKKAKNKKVLILGGEGFIGRNISEAISGCYVCHSAGIVESLFKNKRKDKFIKTDPYQEKVKNDYDVIIHLIDNNVGIDDFVQKENDLIENINLNEKNHLILFSSAVIYANPDSEYGQRKIKLEKIYSDYCEKNKIKVTIFRLFNTYGPYQIPGKQGSLVANIFLNHLSGQKTEINDLAAERDFMYSMDVAKAVRWAIEKQAMGLHDLATSRMISIKNLIATIESSIGEKFCIIDKKSKENIFSKKAKSRVAKNFKLISLKKGLAETYVFYKNNFNRIFSKKNER